MKPVIISLFDEHPATQSIARQQGYEVGEVISRDFPDGERYFRIQTDLNNRDVIILNALDRPNPKILPLILFAETARSLGARRVGLCAPYLAYMRQDAVFQAGEGITSAYFAKLVSQYFDGLVTVAPHLHRHHSLREIYSIPTAIVDATQAMAQWIVDNVEKPLLIGPDCESEQWVAQVAEAADAPYLILEKNRHGDEDVEVSVPKIEPYRDHTPVVVDDIISTAHTMVEAVKQLNQAQMKASICVGIHAVFADHAYQRLRDAGAGAVVTCNTIQHASNQIDLSSQLAEGIQEQLMTL